MIEVLVSYRFIVYGLMAFTHLAWTMKADSPHGKAYMGSATVYFAMTALATAVKSTGASSVLFITLVTIPLTLMFSSSLWALFARYRE